ncbi:MAG: polysaccharide deacetylase family protein [Oscillospiraceae bacterium]
MVIRFKKRYFALLLAVVFLILVSKVHAETHTSSDVFSFPIIMYHHICNDKKRLNDYCITPETFQSDIEYLSNMGYETITVRDLLSYENGESELPEKCVMLTFDDGHESFLKYAYPVLKKYNMTAVMAIVGAFADQFSKIDDHNTDYSYLTWAQIKMLQESGIVEFSNHTYNMHKNAKNTRKGCAIMKNEGVEKYKQTLRQDLNQVQSEFEERTGKSPVCFTYPYGKMCKPANEVIKEMGFRVVFNCNEVNVIPKSREDWLMNLSRYNRPNGKTSEEFFRKKL